MIRPRASLVLLWSVALLVSSALIAPALVLSWSAQSRAHTAAGAQSRAQAAAATLAQARRDMPAWARAQPPAMGLSQRISALLAATGLPPSTLVSLVAEGGDTVMPLLAPGADASDASAAADVPAQRTAQARLVRRRASITLSGLTLPQLGTLLARWRSDASEWVITSLDVTPLDAPPSGSLPSAAGAASPPRASDTRTGDARASDARTVGSDLALRVQLTAEMLALVTPPAGVAAPVALKEPRP